MRKRKDESKIKKDIKPEKDLIIFSKDEFGDIRTLVIGEKPYFCASDVAKALGYSNPNKAVNDHCRAITKRSTPISGKIQEINFIPEGDVYRLIMKSKLSTAEKFESWVMDEVLPTIRKTGGYINNVDLMINTYFSDIPDEQKILVRGLMTNIESLQNRNTTLNNENDLLAQRNLEWADRPLINSLVRAYASSVGDFGKAWNNYKKELLYKHSININSRITNHINTTGKKHKTLDMIDDSELANAISVAVSLCRENNVEIDDLLNNKAD